MLNGHGVRMETGRQGEPAPPPDSTLNSKDINEDTAVTSNHLWATVCAAALCTASTNLTAAGEGTTPLRVEADGALITVVADNAPLKEVLDQLQEQSGFALIEGSASLQHPVTVDLGGVPWRDGLAKLLRGFRYALAMNPETNQPARLVILSSEGSAVQGTSGDGETETPVSAPASGPSDPASRALDQAASSLDEATRIANELMAQREDPLHYAMRTAREAAAAAEAAQEAAEKEQARRATEGEDAAGLDDDHGQGAYKTYANALRALGQFQDSERLDVLAPALGSQSKEVRSAALEAMRDGTVADDTVLGQVRSMATGDADPYVQRDALEVYVRYGDQSDVLSLVQSLGRTSGPTRDIAVREWLRIEKERADAPLADQQLRQAGR
jgi:hypothetical protein